MRTITKVAVLAAALFTALLTLPTAPLSPWRFSGIGESSSRGLSRDQHRIHFRCAEPPAPNPDNYADELLAR